MTQQFDEFGEPLSGGQLYIYQAGTVATPQQPYQDAALTILQPNPIPLDAAGRIPQFFLADGYIKIDLRDRDGITQLARDGVLVIGPSAGGGGGGGGVDPTTILQTGMLSIFYGVGVIAGFVRANARTIGSASSGATERANADCNALFQFLWNADSNLTVSGGRGASSAADWAANKQITLPDCRGRGISGLDDMGNTAAGRLTATYWGGSGIVLGQSGGDEKNLLDTTRIPSHTHANTISVTDLGHTHAINNYEGGVGRNNVNPGGLPSPTTTATGFANISASITNVAAGGGLPHANMQPTLLATIYLKL